MMSVPKVAAIHDLSGLGKCSLTAAIPVLAAMGIQACPLPTAVLSSQTGFPSYVCAELTSRIPAFAAEWHKQGVQFDGIYTGYLCNSVQAQLVCEFLDQFGGPKTLILVDPVLGDSGQFYPAFGPEMCDAVSSLVFRADAITPNLTEACLLTGTDYGSMAASKAPARIWKLAQQLAAKGPRLVVITGVHQGDSLQNFCYSAADDTRFIISTHRMGAGFSGTGDLLASVLCGGLIRGDSPQDALQSAASLLEASIAESLADGTAPYEGVAFEHHLSLIMKEGRT